jgi:hypothetical protein
MVDELLTYAELASVAQLRKEFSFYPRDYIINFLRVYSQAARQHQMSVEPESQQSLRGVGVDLVMTREMSVEELIELTTTSFAEGLLWYRRARELAEHKVVLEGLFKYPT